MLVNRDNNGVEHVKFISYTGEYPNLCSGILTLEVGDKRYVFGDNWKHKENYDIFWHSGGSCGFTNNYEDSYVKDGEWCISESNLPEELIQYASEIDEVFNSNVPQGCCGGCL